MQTVNTQAVRTTLGKEMGFIMIHLNASGRRFNAKRWQSTAAFQSRGKGVAEEVIPEEDMQPPLGQSNPE
jgi:hypothetical protein